MKITGSTLILIVIAAAVAYMLWKQRQVPAEAPPNNQNPSGGNQTSAKQGTFEKILGLLGGAVDYVQAQTGPKTT